MYQILLVEDDKKIQEVIADYIGEKGKQELHLTVAGDGKGARLAMEQTVFDLILLDVMLPDTDGFSICREIRSRDMVPIIFLTARGREEDILWGYGLGCDDYIVKPFSLATLYAKILAVLRRAKGEKFGTVLQIGKITMKLDAYQVSVQETQEAQSKQAAGEQTEPDGGREIILQPKQYELLRYLMTHAGVVVSRDTLLDRVWGYDYMGTDRIVDNQIKLLRKALGSAGAQIKTVVSKGYKMEKR